MLVLSRKKLEAIGIQVPGGPRITVTILRCGGEIVRLGVEAPDEYKVHRDEVWQAIDREQAAGLVSERDASPA